MPSSKYHHYLTCKRVSYAADTNAPFLSVSESFILKACISLQKIINISENIIDDSVKTT